MTEPLLRKDTRNRKGTGPIKRTKSVLAYKRTASYLEPEFFIFKQTKGEYVNCQSILIEKAVIWDMGNPDTITVTIEPGDTIN